MQTSSSAETRIRSADAEHAGTSAAFFSRAATIRRLASGGYPEDDGFDPRGRGPSPIDREDLPYKVELWDESRVMVEQVLAVTASGSIGYAAYFAATREYPHRYVTLRHKNRIVSRWNGPGGPE